MNRLLIILVFILPIRANSSSLYNLVKTLKSESPTIREYCPWRANYTKQHNKEKKECPFCSCSNQNIDNKNYIIKQYKYNALMLNLYPYTPWGNFLIIPKQHTKYFKDLSPEVKLEILEIITACQEVLLKDVSGLNIGINIGEYAGSSIPDHLHFHVVTRKPNEAGFINTIGNLIPVGVNLEEQQQKFKKMFDKYELENKILRSS